jgi:hypothetical protein
LRRRGSTKISWRTPTSTAFRVLETRAQVAIDLGNLFPQTQTMTGDYTRNVLSRDRP